PPIRQPPPHPLGRSLRIEVLGIECPANPPYELLVLLVVGIGKHFQELFVTPNSAHVFGRAGSFTFQAERVPLTRLNPQATLEQYLVPPGISEVIFVLDMKPL